MGTVHSTQYTAQDTGHSTQCSTQYKVQSMWSILSSLLHLLLGSCPDISPPQVVGTVHDPNIPEASSLAVSSLHQDLLWTLNDSGNSATVFGLSRAGDTVTRVSLVGATNEDWEAVEVGPCEVGRDTSCLYVGDIGDNLKHRNNVTIYRVKEPEVIEDYLETETWDKVTLEYPGGEAHDAESLLIVTL